MMKKRNQIEAALCAAVGIAGSAGMGCIFVCTETRCRKRADFLEAADGGRYWFREDTHRNHFTEAGLGRQFL